MQTRTPRRVFAVRALLAATFLWLSLGAVAQDTPGDKRLSVTAQGSAAAREAGATTLWREDFSDGQDYGGVVVMTSCVMGMLLMAGAPWGRFLLLFVLVDGWALVMGTLAGSFYV